MTPNQMNNLIKDRFKDITNMEDYSNKRIVKNLANDMFKETLGIELDSWGDVKNVKDYKFYNEIKTSCKPEMERHRKEIHNKIVLHIKAKTTPAVSKTRINRILDKLIQEIVIEEMELIKDELKEMARVQIKKQLAPWYAMNKMEES